MKILYVCLHSFSSLPYHTREWVEAAIESGHEITVVTSVDPVFLDEIGWKDIIKVVQVEYSGNGIFNYLKNLKNFKIAISLAIEKDKPDLVYERFSTITPVATRICRKKNIPIAVEVNGILEEELKLSKVLFHYRFFMNIIQAYVYPKVDFVFPVTDKINIWLINKYNLPKNRVITIQNGVNPNRFHDKGKVESRKKYDLPENGFIVGYLGSIFSWSGVDLLIDAAETLSKEIPDLYFLIGGGNKETVNKLRDEVKRRGLSSHVRLCGKIPWDNAATFISTFDIATVPADFSGLSSGISPQKLYSYMACQRPVIGSNIDGLGNILEKTGSGIKFNRNETGTMERAILEMQKLPEEKRKAMGDVGRKYILDNHTWKCAVNKVIQAIGATNSGQKSSKRCNPIKAFIKKIPILNKVAAYIYKNYLYKGQHFPGSSAYWEERYRDGGDSGSGSYNKLAQFKAKTINRFVDKNNIQTVIEYGCGDGNQLKLAKYNSFQGFDVSPTAISKCKNLFQNDKTKKFKLMNEYSGETAELTLSLDVIYHLTEDEIFHSYMDKLFDTATKFVIIYSSDFQSKQNHHEKRRKFTKWVECHKESWKLQDKISNEFNDSKDKENFSLSDFYIYTKKEIK